MKGTDTAPRVDVRRLGPGEEQLAIDTFRLMASVFDETPETNTSQVPTVAYAATLLADRRLWALAAFVDGALAGGLTAHALPMTRDTSTELFIYDIAVAPAHQRQGVGRRLVEALLAEARTAGIANAFVPADNDDTHALDFYRAIGGEPAAVTIFTFELDGAR